MKLLAGALFLAAALSAATPVRELQTECPIVSNQSICQFRGGRLFKFDTEVNRVMSVYAADGHFDFMAPVNLPDAAATWTADVAVDSDGSFAVAAFGGRGDIRDITKAGVVLLDGHGIQTASIDTGTFRPTHLVIADDHSIWVLGYQPRTVTGDYNVLRKYSRNGDLQGSYLPRSTFPRGLDPAGSGSAGRLLAAGDLLALVVPSGMNGSHREVIAIDRTGSTLGRMRIDGDPARFFALTTDGVLYGWNAHPGTEATLKRYNPAAQTAVEVEHLAPTLLLLGADGVNLVYRVPGAAGAVKEAWYAQPRQ